MRAADKPRMKYGGSALDSCSTARHVRCRRVFSYRASQIKSAPITIFTVKRKLYFNSTMLKQHKNNLLPIHWNYEGHYEPDFFTG